MFFRKIISFICQQNKDIAYLTDFLYEFLLEYLIHKPSACVDLFVLVTRIWPEYLELTSSKQDNSKKPLINIFKAVITQHIYNSYQLVSEESKQTRFSHFPLVYVSFEILKFNYKNI